MHSDEQPGWPGPESEQYPVQPREPAAGRQPEPVARDAGTRAGILAPTLHPRAVVALAIVAAAAVLGLGLVVRLDPGIDMAIVIWANGLHPGWVGASTDAVYGFQRVPGAIGLLLGAGALAWWGTRSPRAVVTFVLTVAVTWLPITGIKELVDRPRPDHSLLAQPFASWPADPSFPSGHTGFAVALAMGVWFLVRRTRARPIAAVLCVAYPALIVCTVLIVGVHHPTDVLGSIVWSVAVAPAVRLGLVAAGDRIGSGDPSGSRGSGGSSRRSSTT
jgi:membrane-associated phospholipid phosphatase